MNKKTYIFIGCLCMLLLGGCQRQESNSENQENGMANEIQSAEVTESTEITESEEVTESVEATESAEITDAKETSVALDEWPISRSQVTRQFAKIHEIFEEDNGQLWGGQLDTRIMVIDAATRYFVANAQNQSGTLEQSEDVYVGTLPEDIVISNTTLFYDGQNWAMANYETGMPESDVIQLYLHEMFHNVQEELGLVTESSGYYYNSQMDEMQARIYLRLEWAALYQAYLTDGEERLQHISNALLFRQLRRTQYECAEDENRFEIHEGTAEYTAVKLGCSKEETLEYLKTKYSQYDSGDLSDSYVRSFAYFSGPLYGLLLDEYSDSWHTDVVYNSDLGELLSSAANIKAAESFDDAVLNYDYDKIVEEEKKRDETRQELMQKYEEAFVTGPHLTLEEGLNISFNPNSAFALSDLGVVYNGVGVLCNQCIVEISNANVLVYPDYSGVVFSAQDMTVDGNVIQGNGYKITVNDGYELKKVDDNNYEIR